MTNYVDPALVTEFYNKRYDMIYTDEKGEEHIIPVPRKKIKYKLSLGWELVPTEEPIFFDYETYAAHIATQETNKEKE